ncbi:MAG: DNA topoisomerase [Promethearchaeota archaeon]
MATLIISEKNKAARAIAEALGPVNSIKKGKSINVYHVLSKDIYVVPLRGHILSYKNSDAYKSWTKSNPRDIITDEKAIEKVPINHAYSYINALKEYGKICDHCVIGTDADVEGCNIGFHDALPFVKQVNKNITISQMWLNSLQKKEILNKYNNTIPPRFSWGESGEARAIIDAIIGFSATREITSTLKPLLNKFNKQFTSIGRVQTSLLYLIYLRDKKINNFIPQLYFTIEADLKSQKHVIKATHQSNPFKKENESQARNIFNDIRTEKIAKIIKNEKKITQKNPPTPLNTSKALILLTKTLKISANQALNTMNELYLNKIISYPRTDSDVYKESFDHSEILNKFQQHSEFGVYISQLRQKNPTRGKKDAGDHPPITPLESLEKNSGRFENDRQRRVYEILARHYLALFGMAATEERTILKVLIKKELFSARIASLINLGFLEIAPFLKIKYDPSLEILGETIPIEKILFFEKETKPPPSYTDTTILKLMESKRLGTKATRPQMIQILLTRDLIFNLRRNYQCTELGTFLIDQLKDIWLPFLKPDFTRYIEGQLEEIKDEKKSRMNVVEEIKKKFLDLFDKLLAEKSNIISRIDEYSGKIGENTKTLQKYNKKYPLTTSFCPVCKKSPMKLVTTRKKSRFLACSDEKCKSYLSVPKRGRINILKSSCSICGFNIFKITTKKNNKTIIYYLCPQCWTQGLKKQNSSGFCSKCKEYKIENNKCIKK